MQKADKFQITEGGVLVRQFDSSWELSTSFSSRHVLSALTAPLPSFSDPPVVLPHLRGLQGLTMWLLEQAPALPFILNSLPFNVFKDIFA